jgi:hypothetical protein
VKCLKGRRGHDFPGAGFKLIERLVVIASNAVLLRAMVQRKDPAETLEELRKLPLPKLPTPPAGKRIVYDAAICGIRLDPP